MEWATVVLVGLCIENILNWSLHLYHYVQRHPRHEPHHAAD